MEKEKVLRCNKCGKKILVEKDIVREGILKVEWDFGYFSGKDGERHSFCLCESCYDKLRESFAIPVSVEEYL
ncbi:MAG TPA: hypothetical protein IAB97_03490 [Candidatus Choladousia intestinipullorum]|nr:hypothetical protein [Candidatus Choladousia intestinipullorum]